jgi:hypothetical protein
LKHFEVLLKLPITFGFLNLCQQHSPRLPWGVCQGINNKTILAVLQSFHLKVFQTGFFYCSELYQLTVCSSTDCEPNSKLQTICFGSKTAADNVFFFVFKIATSIYEDSIRLFVSNFEIHSQINIRKSIGINASNKMWTHFYKSKFYNANPCWIIVYSLTLGYSFKLILNYYYTVNGLSRNKVVIYSTTVLSCCSLVLCNTLWHVIMACF